METSPTVAGLFRNAKETRKVDAGAIDRRRFLFLVQEMPTFALNVMTVMAAHLRDRD